jgi:hypothetical protein
MRTDPNRKVTPPAVPKKVGDLYLDPKNPRLAGDSLTVEDQTEIARALWREMRVNELIDSIASGGYWQHEEIFAAEEDGKLVVIEGNRRVTAVKLLTDEALQRAVVGATGIPSLAKAAKEKLRELPVVVCSREEIWEYVGFKHVNGPQEWDSIAKAQYIARVFNDYGVPLETIAKSIGDRNDTVRRMYRGLMVLEQAEREGIFDRNDSWAKRFAYSHLWTGLGYAGVQSFLGLHTEGAFVPNPVPKRHLSDLGDLLLWMYGSKARNVQPIVRSQNPDLRNLDEALRKKDGVAALRAGLPLQIALKASQGDERLLREALVKAEVTLKEAIGLIPNGFKEQSDLKERAAGIATIAKSICEQMATAGHRVARKTTPGRRVRR